MSYVSVDTSSESTDKDLKEMKEVVEEAVNGRGAPANGNANEESIDEEEEEGDGKAEDGNKEEQTEAPMSKQVAEDKGDNDVDTKKQKVIEDN
ncbi:prothymosin alpha-like [Microtus ochrogaster]|uniref:Prothymosin alpha n=1 Tax=Microtus ochrogaster TaxID=79684 RepID=A0ABM1UTU9_MICOH|nr:prothymosin alpha-like [Microtus ochrogaster]